MYLQELNKTVDGLVCSHPHINYRFKAKRLGDTPGVGLAMSPVCTTCGSRFHAADIEPSFDGTMIALRLVPGIGGDAVPVE